MAKLDIKARILEGFDDPTFGPEQWEALLASGNSDIVYQTWEWQRAWWDTFGCGQLLLILAERDGQPVALAPLYFDSGMVYFIGTGFESGCLDFIGDISDADVLDSILTCAREAIPEFAEFSFHFISDDSQTGKWLEAAADRFHLTCYDNEVTEAPILELALRPDAAASAIKKKDALYHERLLNRDGKLDVHHLRSGEDILPNLKEFFEMHSARWTAKSGSARFSDLMQRDFIEGLTALAANTDWLRFIRIDWEGRPIAFQYGFCYRGRYTREISTFAIDLARYAPGQVLLRQSFIAAIAENARVFDFGIGDQPYKRRFATRINHVRTWALYLSRSRLAAAERTAAVGKAALMS
jgi:CelD/BcsL family acetyltransferase involved in cellulose biosynthesis